MDLPDWRGTPRPQEGLLMKHESLARNDRRNQGGDMTMRCTAC